MAINAGRGSKLQVLVASAYVTVAKLQKFAFSGLSADLEDASTLDTPTAFKEKFPMMVDAGTVTFNGLVDNEEESQSNLSTLLQDQTRTDFRILLTDTKAYHFSGYVTKFNPADVETSKIIAFSGEVTIDGELSGPLSS